RPYLPIVVAGALNLSERLDLFTTGGLTIAGNISARIIDLSSELFLSEEDFEPYSVTFNQNVSLTATDTIVLPDQLIGTGNASIRLSANNGILTTTSSRIPSAQAGAITANGGITLISRTGAIAVGDLTTAGSNAGGNVVVQARDRITTGAIDTSATDGNGGAVTLDPIGDIEVVSINSQGGTNGRGGAIDITTDRFFRATGTFTDRNGALASLSSAGGNGGGQITIRHGGGLLNTPYDVGSTTRNATAGVITTGEFTIAEGRSFPRSYTLGNISLITTDPTQDTDTPTTYDGILPDLRATENLAIANPETLTPIKSLSEVQASLSAMEAATGIKPAVIYVRFVNPTLPPNDNFLERETALTQEFEEHLGIPSYTALQIAPQPTDQLELLIVTPEGNPIRRLVPVTREQITATATSFRGLITQTSSSPNRYLPPAQLLYGWLVAPVEQDLQTLGIQNLTFILDAGLRSLPLAALHDGNQFLVERYSVGLMPSFSLTNTRYIDLRDTQVLAMGASSFTEQPALPAVPTELAAITQTLWNGKSLINEAFTVEGLVDQRRQQPFAIVHLATHGEFNAGAIENSYIQFWDQRLRLDQIRQLNFNRPPVELLVLSACRTALGNEQAELGFAGLAVQSGVQSALASLWYVSDTGTLGLMTEFYRQLQQVPIKAEALRRAQVAMINGQIQIEQGMLIGSNGDAIALPETLSNTGATNLPHPYYWSAFTLIGSPW
ncbi:MAG TPA: CHAT domain-containing protein, partial [Chroococcidiopsis sp.]